MPVRAWIPPKQETDLTNRFKQLWDDWNVQYQRHSYDPSTAKTIANLKRTYPSMSANTAVAGGMAGLEPNSDTANLVANKDFSAQVRHNGFGIDDIGRWAFLGLGYWAGKTGLYPTLNDPEMLGRLGEFGATLGSGGDIARHGVGAAIPEPGRNFAKDVTRGGMTIFDTVAREAVHRPFTALTQARPRAEEEMGEGNAGLRDELREFGEAWREYGPSAGVRAGQAALRGEEVDLGTGFFQGGQLEAAAEAQRQNLKDPRTGLAATPGRGIAAELVDPDDVAFDVISGLVDFGIALADPTALAGGKLRQVRQARKIFTVLSDSEKEAGLVNGLRRSVKGPDTQQWLNKRTDIQDWAVNVPDNDQGVYEAWEALGRDRVPRQLAVDIAGAKTRAEAVEAFGKQVGLGAIRTTEDITGTAGARAMGAATGVPLGRMGARARPFTSKVRMDDVRLLKQMPSRHLNVWDFDESATTLDDYMANGKVSRAKRAEVLGGVLRGEEGFDNLLDRAVHAQEEVYKSAVAHGMPEEVARRHTTMYKGFQTEVRHYYVTKAGEDAAFPGVRTLDVGGVEKPVGTPHIGAEYTTRTIPLANIDDIRAIRRQTAVLSPIYNTLPAKYFFGLHDKLLAPFTEMLWKPAVLLRAAIIPRVVGEEQARIGGAGYDSLFSAHPISAVSWLTGQRAKKDFYDLDWDDVEEWASAQSQRGMEYRGHASGVDGPAMYLNGDRIVRYKADTLENDYLDFWGGRLGIMSSDDVVRRAAGGLTPQDMATLPEHYRHLAPTSPDALKAWFKEGGGREHLDFLAKGGPGKRVLYEPGQADKHIDTVYERLEVETGGNPDLLQAIADRGMAGVAFRPDTPVGELRNVLRGYYDSAPEALVADRELPANMRQRMASQWDTAINWGFENAMSRPTNYWSRSISFRQMYAERAVELIPFVDDAARARMVRWAERYKLPEHAARMKDEAARVAAGPLDLKSADHVAKAYALQGTQDLLYDVSRRGQLSDILRVWVPFLEPYKEGMTSWARILRRDPVTVPRRVQQVITYGERNGKFTRDDGTGELYFTYPFVGGLISVLSGQPYDTYVAKGRISGLNMLGNLQPGAGVALQLPASYLIPNTPGWKWLNDFIMPFGEMRIDTPEDLGKLVLPAWAQKMFSAWAADEDNPELVDQFGSHTANAIRILGSSGKYDLGQQGERERLERDAISLGKKTLRLSGMFQFGLPTGPNLDINFQDKDARWFTAQVLSQDYRDMMDKHRDAGNPHAEFLAMEEFVKKYGFDPSFAVQGKSYATGKVAETEEQRRWLAARPEAAKKYPGVYGWFAPNPNDELELEQWGELLNEGSRRPLTTEEMIQAAMNRRSWAEWRGVEMLVGDRTDAEARQYKREKRAAIEATNPRWHDDVVPTGIATDVQIGELRRAAHDPMFNDNPVAKGLRQWFDSLDQAQEQATSAHGKAGWETSNETVYLRNWLAYERAPELIATYPDMAPLLERLWFRNRSIEWEGDSAAMIRVMEDEEEDEDQPSWMEES